MWLIDRWQHLRRFVSGISAHASAWRPGPLSRGRQTPYRPRHTLTNGAKQAFLHVSRWLGLFHLSRRLTRHRLRILCYHGFALHGESAFRPGLFIEPATFRERLQWLADHNYSVIPLARAVEGLGGADLPALPTVITIDDGFFGTYARALPLLRQFGFPATVYVTSYYVVKENPVFGVLIDYMFWRTARRDVHLNGLGVPALRARESIATPVERRRVVAHIVRYGETHCEESGRVALARALAQRLDLDYDAIARDRFLNLMTPAEIVEAAQAGLDIQLHSHRHRFPEDQVLAVRELVDNKAALEPRVENPLTHFCYPDGLWSRSHWPWLEAAGVISATTCDPGLNDSRTPRFALKRFLDGEHISSIEFAAELSGYLELLRAMRDFGARWLRRLSDRDEYEPPGRRRGGFARRASGVSRRHFQEVLHAERPDR